MYGPGDELASVVEEAAYFHGLRTSTGWPEVDSHTGGMAPGAIWTITCEHPVIRRSLASWFAARLGSLRGRSVMLSTTMAAHESVLHVLAPLIGRAPHELIREREDESTWPKADRTWSSLDLVVAGPDDNLDEVLLPTDRTIHGLVVDRADLLPPGYTVKLCAEGRRGRRWTVLTSPTSTPSRGLEPGDVSITVDRVDAWDARMLVSTAIEDTWFNAVVTSVGRWQVSPRPG